MRCLYFITAVSQKSGFASFPVVFFSYIVLQLACLVITVVTLYPIVFIPPACILLYGVVLRLHVVKRFNITSQNMCVECLQGFFCCCCSTAQSKWRYCKNAIMKMHTLLFHIIAADCMCAFESFVSPARCKHRNTFLLDIALFSTVLRDHFY